MLLTILLEALWDISILPFGDQNTFYATLQFQPELGHQLVVMATLGAILACVINWCVGRFIYRHLNKKYASSDSYVKLKSGFAEYGWAMLFLTWVTLGNFLPLFAAALGYPLKRTVLLCAITMAGFYIYQLLNVA